MSVQSSSRNWKVRSGVGLLVVAAALVVMKTSSPTSRSAPVPEVQLSLGPIAVPAVPLDKEMQIRPDLREALGKVAGIAAQQRLDLLDAVRGTLSPVECDALLHELLEPRAPSVSEGWYSVYVQNICLILRDQPKAQESYSRVLAQLAKDPSRDAVVRDYAVQHLRQVWDRAAESPAVRQGIENSFRDLATGSEPAMAATGLLSLHLLGTVQGAGAIPDGRNQLPRGMNAAGTIEKPAYHLTDDALQPLIAGILSKPPAATNIPLRLTAVRIISDRRLSASRGSLRELLSASSKEHALVRMAAIAALGRFTDSSDRPLLESLDRSDPRIDAAVRGALASIH